MGGHLSGVDNLLASWPPSAYRAPASPTCAASGRRQPLHADRKGHGHDSADDRAGKVIAQAVTDTEVRVKAEILASTAIRLAGAELRAAAGAWVDASVLHDFHGVRRPDQVHRRRRRAQRERDPSRRRETCRPGAYQPAAHQLRRRGTHVGQDADRHERGHPHQGGVRSLIVETHTTRTEHPTKGQQS